MFPIERDAFLDVAEVDHRRASVAQGVQQRLGVVEASRHLDGVPRQLDRTFGVFGRLKCCGEPRHRARAKGAVRRAETLERFLQQIDELRIDHGVHQLCAVLESGSREHLGVAVLSGDRSGCDASCFSLGDFTGSRLRVAQLEQHLHVLCGIDFASPFCGA